MLQNVDLSLAMGHGCRRASEWLELNRSASGENGPCEGAEIEDAPTKQPSKWVKPRQVNQRDPFSG